MKYYISDLHLFHEKIMQLPNSDRPFKDVWEMHETIKKNWISKGITNKDEVYILGDVGMYHEKEIASFFNKLPGRKYLVTGNHDIYNIKDKDFCKAFQWVKTYAEIRDKGRKVILFHYPIEEWDGFYRGAYHIHGHTHAEVIAKIPGRYNVSCDVIDFTPQTLDELILTDTVF